MLFECTFKEHPCLAVIWNMLPQFWERRSSTCSLGYSKIAWNTNQIQQKAYLLFPLTCTITSLPRCISSTIAGTPLYSFWITEISVCLRIVTITLTASSCFSSILSSPIASKISNWLRRAVIGVKPFLSGMYSL